MFSKVNKRRVEFWPPISTRDTDELIAIANSSTTYWQQEAIDQAKEELIKGQVSNEYQQSLIETWEKENTTLELEYQKQLKLNETDGYTWGEMAGILFASPFILVGRWNFDLSLIELRKQNYKKKFKQRLILLIIGPFVWGFFLMITFSSKDEQKIKEAEQIDISEWEKNIFGSDRTKKSK